MAIVIGVGGAVLVLVVLWEGFETIVLPRRVTRRFRLTSFFYRRTWLPWARLVGWCLPPRRQDTWLGFFGPLSLLLLFGVWAVGLITGFALLYFSAGQVVDTHKNLGFLTNLYLSATTFFTLGLGDVTPGNGVTRLLVVLESGMGFGFLALVIAYLPALNQSFSNREVSVSLLDARAGSPPTACEILRRHGDQQGMEALRQLLHEWERWSAFFLEGHLSFPVLAYFRSQHDNQSWLGALAAILDTCALVMVGVEGACERQAELTFAMARHALVDLSLVFRTQPRRTGERLPPEELERLRSLLEEAGVRLRREGAEARLAELRALYEPYLQALASYFRLTVPSWTASPDAVDNWQASGWERWGAGKRPAEIGKGEHF